VFTAQYGKGNKIELTDRRTDSRAWKQRRAPSKATSRRKLQKEKTTQKLTKWCILCTCCVWLLLVMFIFLLPTEHRQTDVSVTKYLVITILVFMATIPDKTTKVHQIS